MLLFAGFLPQQPHFNPKAVNMGLMVYKVALGHILLCRIWFFLDKYHSTNAP